jgi:hypothetical protein
MNHIEDRVTTKPTMTGPFGRAWRVDIRAQPATKGRETIVDFYVVECPGAHPAWHSYLMFAMDLAPRPGLADAVLYLPKATHEFHIWALNPEAERQSIIEAGDWVGRVLTPMNFGAQVCMSQLEVEAKLVASVADVIHGRMSPDTDYVRSWAKMWGDNMLKDR